MNQIEKKIIELVDKNKDDFISFFQELVKFPSFTGQEKEIGEALVNGMRARGFEDIEVIERIPGHPNVLAHIRGTEGPTYTFNGHLDIIVPQKNEQWPHPPFSADIEDGKIYGRGTVDMKSGTFASFFAGLIVKELGIPLHGNVLFTAVCDEMICGDNGILYLLDKGYVKMNSEDDFGLNCEPTNLMEMNIATKGVMQFSIKVHGKSAFNARPYLGISAIDKASKLIDAIVELNEKIRSDESLNHPLLERPSVAVSMIQGGEAFNLIPDLCTLTIARRLLPCETEEGCLNDFRDIIERLHSEDPEFSAEIICDHNFRPPVEVPADAPIVDVIRRAQLLVTGKEMGLIGSQGGTDASLIVYRTGMPMPVYGPGDYKLLGTVNECVSIEDFLNAIKIYALSIYYTLGIDEQN